MKNLNKKIVSMALAGMVVAGGVAVSGVSAHAASLSPSQERDIQKVNFWCRDYGSVEVKNSEKELNDSLKDYSNRQMANNGKIISVKNPSQIPVEIQNAKRYGRKVVKVEYRGLYYLIKVK